MAAEAVVGSTANLTVVVGMSYSTQKMLDRVGAMWRDEAEQTVDHHLQP
jgi:hypothetical protein